MNFALPELIVEQGWNDGIPDSIRTLEEMQETGAYDMEPVLGVLRAHKHLPGPVQGYTLVPNAEEYPSLAVLDFCLQPALMQLRDTILSTKSQIGTELRKIVTLFGLYGYRAAALAREPGYYPEEDPIRAVDVLRYIAPIDTVFSGIYAYRLRPDIRKTMFIISMHAYEMFQNFCAIQEHSGQSPETFFMGLHRRASAAHLSLLYESLAFPLISAPNRFQKMTHRELLRLAEIATPPSDGARVQSIYARELGADLRRTGTGITDIQVHLLRPAENIWPALVDVCAQCGLAATRRCTRCKRVKYCTSDCQTAHWKPVHKGACILFTTVNGKLVVQGYPLPWTQ